MGPWIVFWKSFIQQLSPTNVIFLQPHDTWTNFPSTCNIYHIFNLECQTNIINYHTKCNWNKVTKKDNGTQFLVETHPGQNSHRDSSTYVHSNSLGNQPKMQDHEINFTVQSYNYIDSLLGVIAPKIYPHVADSPYESGMRLRITVEFPILGLFTRNCTKVYLCEHQ